MDIILDRKSVVPLYYQLKEQLYDKIKSGELPSGSLLPSETELCDTYGLSRGTVRQAINMLAEKGYVTRERGKGTCVRRPTLNHDLLGDYSFGLGIRKLGLKLKNIPLVVEVVCREKEELPTGWRFLRRLTFYILPESGELEMNRGFMRRLIWNQRLFRDWRRAILQMSCSQRF